MQANPQSKKVMVWGLLLLVPVGVLLSLSPLFVPESLRAEVGTAFVGACAAVYVAMLSRSLKPLREIVDLYADGRGLFAKGSWIAPRPAIVEAYIRPPTTAQSVKGVAIPAWPLTVEIIATTGQLNLDPGGEQAAQQILYALGFPIVTVSPTHVARKLKK
jgi:hypothetical protein